MIRRRALVWTVKPLPTARRRLTVEYMMQLWSSSNPSRQMPAGEATLPKFGCIYRHAGQVKAMGEG